MKALKIIITLTLIANILMAQDSLIEKAMQDPVTNTIRWDLIYKNLENKILKKTRAGNLDFIEAGPFNMAGRVTTMVFNGSIAFCSSDNGGIWKNDNVFDVNSKWKSVTTNYPLDYYNVSCLAIDPNNANTIYAATGGNTSNYKTTDASSFRATSNGIFKSTDGGLTWTVISFTQPSNNNNITAIINKIVVANNGDVFVASFVNTTGAINFGGIYRFATTATSLTLVKGNFDAFSEGYDIEKASNGDIWIAYRLSNTTREIARCRFGAGAWVTKVQTINGTTIGTSTRIELATAPSNNDRIYAGIVNGNTPTFISTNNGATVNNTTSATWASLTSPPTTVLKTDNLARDFAIAVDPLDPDVVVVGSENLVKTTNGMSTAGNWVAISTWNGNNSVTATNLHPDIANLYYPLLTDSKTAIVCSDGGISISKNMDIAAPTWARVNNYLAISQYYSCATAINGTDKNFFGGSQDNGVQLIECKKGLKNGRDASSGDGFNAFMGNYDASGFVRVVGSTNGILGDHEYMANTYPFTVNSFDFSTGGNSNTKNFSGGARNVTKVPSDYNDFEKIIITKSGGNNIRIFRNVGIGSATGASFQDFTISQLVTPSDAITFIKNSPTNSKVFYLGTNLGKIYKIEWTRTGTLVDPLDVTLTITTLACTGFVAQRINYLDFKGSSDVEILITTLSSGTTVSNIWHSTNSGANFTSLENTTTANSITNLPIWCAKFIDATAANTISAKIVLGTELGVYYTDNINGTSTAWLVDNANNSCPNVRVTDMQYRKGSDGLLLISTYGRGMWYSYGFCANKYSFTNSWQDCTLKLTNTSGISTPVATWDVDEDGVTDYTGNTLSICLKGRLIGSYITMTQNSVATTMPVNEIPTAIPGGISSCCFAPPPNFTLEMNSMDNLNSNDLIYPNPAKNLINFKGDGEIEMFQLMDLQGNITFENSNQNNFQIDISNYANGIYLYLYKKAGHLLKGKIIKE